MPLDPIIDAILRTRSPLPPLETLGVAELRRRLNYSARAAKLNVPLAGIVDRAIPGAGGELGVRIYTPASEGPYPLLVYLHGGGYVLGDLDISDDICRGLAAGANCVVMSVDYRLAPEHPFPAAPNDAWAALCWAFDNARSLNADPARVAIAGDSAGGNLAAAAAIRARDSGKPLKAQLLLYASPDYPDPTTESVRQFADGPMLRAADSRFYWSQYLTASADISNPMAAPARATSHRDLAKAFIASAECDPSRDLGERYAVLLRAAGVPVTARRYAGMPHGFLALIAYVPAARAALDEICDWLASQLVECDGDVRQKDK